MNTIIAIRNCASFKFMLRYEQKGRKTAFGTPPQSFYYLVIALSTKHCSKSADKFAVRVCQVPTVVMATTQLVLSRFKIFLSHQLRIECGPSLPKIISKSCEL